MTNCLAPYSESSSIYKAYSSNGMLSSSIGFVIPIYENMPKYSVESPNILDSDYNVDNKKVYANVTGNLNVRSGPSTSYEIITTVNKTDKLTRIKKGKQSGERWDKVELANGIVGYVFQNYLVEIPDPVITGIKLSVDNNVINKGSSNNINIELQPQGVSGDIIWSSSDENIVSVDKGRIVGISAGTATITAKTLDGKISNSIEITVYSQVSNISLSKEELTLFTGKTAKIIANILPEDATDKTLNWTSNNEEIASVTQDGTISAISPGETEIIVKNKEQNVEEKCKLTVVDIEEDITLNIDSSLRVEADEISKINISKSTVEDITKLINTNLNLEFYDIEGNILNETDLIGTNTKLILKDDTGKEIYKFIFIVYGDVNGDGLINSLDVLVLQKYILETKSLTGIFLKAGNISKNGNLPSSLDVLKIQKHILETKFIEQ